MDQTRILNVFQHIPVQLAKDNGTAIDATCGRRTKSVIICDSGHVVMSAQTPETISGKTSSDEE